MTTKYRDTEIRAPRGNTLTAKSWLTEAPLRMLIDVYKRQLLLLLGGAFCLVYGRQREVFLLLALYVGYFLLDSQVDHFRESGQVRDDAALVFHLVCLLLPLLYALYGCWEERSHLAQDMLCLLYTSRCV